MTVRLWADNAEATLASGITDSATSLTLATGKGALFPSPAGGDYFVLTLTQASSETSWEKVKVTARSTDTLTVVRGYEGSTAAAWDAGAKAELRWTSGWATDTVLQPYDADIPTVAASQSEMETGTEAGLRAMSPLRVAQAITAQTQQDPGDTYWANTTFLCHANGTNAASYTGADKGTSTAANVTYSTAQKKFGTASCSFNGTSSAIEVDKTCAVWGTGNFTVECFVRTSVNTTGMIFSSGNYVAEPIFVLELYNGTLSCNTYLGGGTSGYRGVGGAVSNDTWYHVAIVKNNGYFYLYINGTSQGSFEYSYLDGLLTTADGARWGAGDTPSASFGAQYFYTGYLDEMRITIGVARYTADFTAPTAPFLHEFIPINGEFLTVTVGESGTGNGAVKLDGITGGRATMSVDDTVTKVTFDKPLEMNGNLVGTMGIVQNSKSENYTTVLTDAGKCIFHPSADTSARTFTIDSNANVAYPIGTTISFDNQNGAGVVTIAITTDTMRLAGAGTTGSRTLAANGYATATKETSTEWKISGVGLT